MSEINIEGIVLKQKDLEFLVVGMTIQQIRRLFYVFRKSKNDPDALERQLIPKKVKDIDARAGNKDIYFPNAIILNVTEVDRVNIETANENGILANINFTVQDDRLDDTLDNVDDKIGYIIDGQHRIEGLQNYPSFKLPVVIFMDIDSKIAYKTFAEINKHQDKVNNLLLNYIRYEIQDYGTDDTSSRAFEIVFELNEDKDSPLSEKIRIFEDEKRKWLNQPTMQRLVNQVISEDGPIFSWNKTQQIEAIKNYLNAWKRIFPEAWDIETRDKYVLTKAMGITIIFNLFERFFTRCSLYEGKHTVEAFENQIKDLDGGEFFDGIETYPLNWDTDIYGKMSSGKGIRAITRQILRLIPQSGPPNL